MFKRRDKISTMPSATSATIPNGVLTDTFLMDFDGEEVKVGVVEVQAKNLALKPVAGNGKKQVSLKSVITGVAITDTGSVEYKNYKGVGKVFGDGDVIVYVSHNFKTFSGIFNAKARQIIIAYEAAKAYGLYKEVYSGNEPYCNTLAVEECAIQFLSTLDYNAWSVFSALKRLNCLNEKESRKFFRALKKLNKKKAAKAESYFEESDLEELRSLTA